MRSDTKQRLAIGLLTAACLGLVAGCDGTSERDLVASANQYLEKNDRKAAIVQLKAALQKNPQLGEARYLLGKSLLEEGDVPAALVELGKAADAKYDDSLVLPPLARAMIIAGQERKLTDLYSRVTLPDPIASAALKSSIALAWAAQGQWDRCQAAVDAALQSDPNNVDAKLLLSRMTAARGQMAEALAILETIIAGKERSAAAYNLKGELLWVGQNDRKGAAAAYRAAIESDPRLLPAHSSLIALLLQERDLPAAKQQLDVMRKAHPSHPETRFVEAQITLLEGQNAKARELVLQLLKFAPDNHRVLQLAGAIELQLGSLLMAETHFNKALQIAPALPLARRLLADTQLRGGQPAKALTTLQPLFERRTIEADALALAAEAYLQLGDSAKAEAFYQRAAKVSPTDPKLRTALAMAQIAKGNATGGFSELENVAVSDTTAYADLALISARMRQGNLDDAVKAIERLKTKLPGKALPYHLQGRIQALRKDFTGARASLEKALSLDPAYFPAVAGLAQMDMQEKKPDVAIKRFEAMLARAPNNFNAVLAIAEIRRRSGDKPEDIQKLLSDAVRLGPTEAEPRLLLIEHYLKRGDVKAANAAASDAVAAMPSNPSVLEALGRVQLTAGNVQQALSSFGKLVTALPLAPEPHLRLAEAHLQNRDPRAAEQSYKRALSIRADFVPAQKGLIGIALGERRGADALGIARAVQQRWPSDPVGPLLVGEVHLALKEYDKAAVSYRSALQLGNLPGAAIGLHVSLTKSGQAKEAERLAQEWERDPTLNNAVLAYLAATSMSAGRYAQAEGLYRRMLKSEPEDVLALNNTAWLLLQQGKPGALALAETANSLQPNRPALMDTKALALAAEGKLALAVELQKQAVALSPEDAGLRWTFAKLLIKAGDTAKAKSELTWLSGLGTKFADHAEVSKMLKGL